MKLGDRKGHSVIEVALMLPWLFFLFVGIADFGFYAHALISTENAARAAAITAGRYSSANLGPAQTAACLSVFNELQAMPNASSLPAGCGALPLLVSTSQFTDADGNLGVQVQVSYQPIPMIPVPGLLPQQLTMTRTVQAPIYGAM